MTEDGVQYEHTLQDQAGHEPVPVTPRPNWQGGRCDFCNADHPVWVLPVKDFTVPTISDHSSLGWWAACEKCAIMIRAGNWKALEKQAFRRLVQLSGGIVEPEGKRHIRSLYAKVRENTCGPLQPLH